MISKKLKDAKEELKFNFITSEIPLIANLVSVECVCIGEIPPPYPNREPKTTAYIFGVPGNKTKSKIDNTYTNVIMYYIIACLESHQEGIYEYWVRDNMGEVCELIENMRIVYGYKNDKKIKKEVIFG